jgi:surface antigen
MIMKKIAYFIMTSVLAVSLVGCETSPTSEDTGQVIGGVIGGVLGSQIGEGSGRTAATIAGVMIGAYIGGRVGKSMDEKDRYNANEALENNPTNQPSSWTNPDTGNEYEVTPTSTYTASSGEPCREYTTEAVIDGRKEIITGTACRQPDGTWRAAN